MRDVIVTVAIFGALPFALRSPYIGILLWSWLSYMNPHRLCWGFAYNLPFAQIVAIVMMLSLAINKPNFKLPKSAIFPVWGLFVLWMCISTAFAIYPEWAVIQLIKVLKIQLIVFLTVIIVRTKDQLIGTVWVIAMSIAFFGVKGGLFTIRTGGSGRVWGPPGSFIEDNNELAVALLMALPLLWFLRSVAGNVWLKRAMTASLLLCTLAILGSQSRGAFLGIMAVAAFLVVKSKARIPSVFAVVIGGALLFTFMPQSWHDRMSTIQNYEEDRSAMGRINAWTYTVNVANDRLSGAGFESWSPETFARWAPDPDAVHAAHSIFFSILGDHGWPGIVLCAIIAILTWRAASRIRRKSRHVPELEWAETFSRMCQVTFVAYGVGGAFLSLAYFDLPWHLMALTIVCEKLVNDHLAQPKTAAAASEQVTPRAGPRGIGASAPGPGAAPGMTRS